MDLTNMGVSESRHHVRPRSDPCDQVALYLRRRSFERSQLEGEEATSAPLLVVDYVRAELPSTLIL